VVALNLRIRVPVAESRSVGEATHRQVVVQPTPTGFGLGPAQCPFAPL